MATIKSYSDFQQSKKLAEILPLESADMFFNLGEDKYADSIKVPLTKKHWEQMIPDINPCWSLAALLGVLPKIEHLKPFIDLSPELDSDKVAIYYHSENSPYIVRDNLIDACYEMILKLHELKML